MATGPITDADRERIRQLHAEGLSCRAIARELGRSPASVGNHAKAMGLQWDQSRTAAATEAHKATNADRRARLVARLYGRADKIMDRLEADQFKLVGLDKDGYARTNVIAADAIPGAEERALTGMVVNLLAGAAKLELVDAGTAGLAEAKGILGNLSDALAGAYGQLSHTGGTPTAKAVRDDVEGDQ